MGQKASKFLKILQKKPRPSEIKEKLVRMGTIGKVFL